MPSRLVCWFQGHDWGAWQTGWTNLFGAALDIRYCAQCGARDARKSAKA